MFVYKRVYTTKQQKLDVPIKIVSPGIFFCIEERRISPPFPNHCCCYQQKKNPFAAFSGPQSFSRLQLTGSQT